MKILIVTGKLTYSNPTTYTLELVRGLKLRNHDVMVTHHGGPLAPALAKLDVEQWQMRGNVFSFRRLVEFFRAFGPQIVHATGGPRALKSAARIANKIEVPVIHTIHSWLPEDRDARLPRQLRGIIAVNENLREHLVNSLNVPKQLIRVVPYGVDGELHRPAPGDTDAGRVPVVGVIGRLERGRRYDEFIKAAQLIETRRSGAVHFVIAGEGPDEGRLRAMVRGMKLAEVVTFVQPQRGAREIYQLFDVMVVVSDWGGVGLNLLEGMAHERAVIATGGGEVYSILGLENTCVLVAAGDTVELADAILALLAAPEQRRELGANARRYVLANYPLEQQVLRVEDFYLHVAGVAVA
ncbi:MAG: glycosyltransferase family 4 protein [Planctomycetes bacterium]|nr:glycosyltransferase family 4 protein [Planctomycetota bacterium]